METRLILLVEDNSNDEHLTMRALKRSGIPVRIEVARDGLEAVQYLKDSRNPRPDLVLLDLKLPKLNGTEVLIEIRKNKDTRRIPVVMFTSSNEKIDITNCIDAGANSYVQKSVDYSEYVHTLQKITEYWLMIDEPQDLTFEKQSWQHTGNLRQREVEGSPLLRFTHSPNLSPMLLDNPLYVSQTNPRAGVC